MGSEEEKYLSRINLNHMDEAIRRLDAGEVGDEFDLSESQGLLRLALATGTEKEKRARLDVRYRIGERVVIGSMDISGLGELNSQEEIVEAANRLTRRYDGPGRVE